MPFPPNFSVIDAVNVAHLALFSSTCNSRFVTLWTVFLDNTLPVDVASQNGIRAGLARSGFLSPFFSGFLIKTTSRPKFLIVVLIKPYIVRVRDFTWVRG
jgi:hypothetical protein